MPENTPTFLPEALEGKPFRVLAELCEAEGWHAAVIGGFVRDYLLGQPGTDIDVVTEGDGIALAEAFAARSGARDVHVYRNFGTAMVHLDSWQVEFVGARKESYRRDSRKPEVAAGTLAEDQWRRDFTINALSLSLMPADFGRLNDPFGGVQDLREQLIRTPAPPAQTFSDDPLRMLRAVRFAARLNFHIEQETYEAIRTNAERLAIVSRERIAEELNKTLLTPQPSRGFKPMFHTGLLEQFFIELQAMQGVESRDGVRHKDNFFHTLKVVDKLAPMTDALWLRWAALLHDIGKPRTKRFQQGGWTFHGHEDVGARMVPKIFRRLKLPLNEKMRYVQKLVRLHQRPIALAAGEVSDSAIRRLVVEADEDLEDLLTLCRADITTRDARREARYLRNYDALEERIRHVQERDRLRNWQPPLDGKDIMTAYNLPPCYAVGRIKEAIREAILEGEIANEREAAQAYMERIAPAILREEGQWPAES